MSDGTKTLKIIVTGESSSAQRALKATADAAKGLNSATKESNKAMATFRSASVGIVNTALGFSLANVASHTAAAIKDFFSETVAAGRNAAAAMRQTEAVLRSTGGAASLTSASYTRLVETTAQVAGQTNLTVRQVGNLLLTFNGVSGEIYQHALPAVLDMAAAMHVDSVSAAKQLGKALQDPVAGMTALRRAGVVFNADQQRVIKDLVTQGNLAKAQGMILDELARKTQGSAAAQAGAAVRARVAMENLKEEVGLALVPTLDKLAKFFTSMIAPALGDFAKGLLGSTAETASATDTYRKFGQEIATVAKGLFDAGRVVSGAVTPALHGMFSTTVSAIGPFTTAALVVEMMLAQRIRSAATSAVGSFRSFTGSLDLARVYMRTAALNGVSLWQAQTMVNAACGPLAGSLGGVAGRMQGAAVNTNTFRGALAGVQGVGRMALTGLSGLMGVLGGPWGVALMGATVAVGLLTQHLAAQRQASEATKNALRGYAQALKDGATPAALEQAKTFIVQDKTLQALITTMSKVPNGEEQVIRGLMGDATARQQVVNAINAQEEALRAQMAVSNATPGQIKAARIAIDALEEQRKRLVELSAEQEKANLLGQLVTAGTTQTAAATEQLNGSLAEGADVTSQLTPEQQKLSDAMNTLADSTASATDKARALKDAEDSLWGTTRSVTDTSEAMHRAQMDLHDSFAQNGADLSENTRAGLANRDALEAAYTAVNDYIAAQIASGMSLEAATALHDKLIAAIDREIPKNLRNTQTVKDLKAAYSSLPPVVTTTVNMDSKSFKATADKLGWLQYQQYALAQGKTPTVVAAEWNAIVSKAAKMVPGLARGGAVHGRGTSTSDDIPARLSDREFVEPAESVDYYGVDFFEALRHRQIPKGQVPGLKAGGYVTTKLANTWPFNASTAMTRVPTLAEALSKVTITGLSSGLVAGATNWLWAQRGKPYNLGSVGPSAYDCSGLVGNVWAYLTGHPLYHRYMTAKYREAERLGFKQGEGTFTIGINDGSHTMGRLNGLLFEAGSPVHVGSGTSNFNSFGRHYYLPGVVNSSVSVGSSSASGGPQAYAQAQLGRYGWGQDQWAPLKSLWQKESGWNAWAVNKSSGAYGIPQALGHGHPFNLGDYVAQINWGLNYIKGRYGSPLRAWEHSLAYNWYRSGGLVFDRGGTLSPGFNTVYNGTGHSEPLVPMGSNGQNVNVTVNVHGNVTAERELAKTIATSVRDELLRHANRNGGRTGF